MSLFSDTIGGIPQDLQTISPARAMAKWNHNLKGVEIIQLANTYPGMEVHCIESYLDIFVAGHNYNRSSDNGRWIDTTQKIHRHDTETDEGGGSYNKIMSANAANWVVKDFDPVRGGQWDISTQGGEGENSTGSFVMKTNNVAGNYYQITAGGNRVSYEDQINMFMKYELVTAHSARTSFRGGVGCEEVWEISSIRRMFGVEFCDDAGQDRTYMLFSSDGSERNSVVTAQTANNQNNVVHALQFQFYPTALIKLILDGNAIIATKTDAIPRTLATGATDTLRFGIRTVENADKQYRLRSVRMVGTLSPLAAW